MLQRRSSEAIHAQNCGLILDAWPDFANTLDVELILLLLIYGIVKCRAPKLHTVQARAHRAKAKRGSHRQLCTIVIACNMRDIIHFLVVKGLLTPAIPVIRTPAMCLEIFLAPHETESWLTPFVALDVKCASQTLGTTEEHTSLGGRVDLADGFEDHVPVRTTEVCWCAQSSDGILLRVGVVDHDICCVVGLDLSSEVLLSISNIQI